MSHTPRSTTTLGQGYVRRAAIAVSRTRRSDEVVICNFRTTAILNLKYQLRRRCSPSDPGDMWTAAVVDIHRGVRRTWVCESLMWRLPWYGNLTFAPGLCGAVMVLTVHGDYTRPECR